MAADGEDGRRLVQIKFTKGLLNLQSVHGNNSAAVMQSGHAVSAENGYRGVPGITVLWPHVQQKKKEALI